MSPAGTYTIPVPDTSIAPGKRWDVDEVIDEAALQAICESYDPAINGGNGIQVNNDHLHLRTTGDNPALGWCKALDYGRSTGTSTRLPTSPGSRTPTMNLNQGKYWAFSTEYKLADYKRVYDNGYSPTRLSGLAVTNNPDHEAQPGIIRQSAAGDVVVHSRSATISQTTTMSKKATQQRGPGTPTMPPEMRKRRSKKPTPTMTILRPLPRRRKRKRKTKPIPTTTTKTKTKPTATRTTRAGWDL